MQETEALHTMPGSFVVIGDARTGTSMLRHLLDAHPDVHCLGEYLSNDVATLLSQPLPRPLARFAQTFARTAWFKRVRLNRLLRRPAAARSFGFKALYEQLPPTLLPAIDRKIERHILILRRDRVRRALSLLNAEASGRWNRTLDKAEPDATADAPRHVAYDDLTGAIERTERLDELWVHRLGSLAQRGFILYYEDLVTARTDSLINVFRFLGVDEAPAQNLTPKTARMSTPRPLSYMIANIDSLYQAAEGSRFFDLLQEFELPQA